MGKKLAYLLTSMLGIVVIFLSVAYGAFYHYYGKMNITSDEDFEYLSKIDIQQGEDIDYSTMTDEERAALDAYDNSGGNLVYDFNDDVVNIMLVGTDSRTKGLYRTNSDSMIILSINKSPLSW